MPRIKAAKEIAGLKWAPEIAYKAKLLPTNIAPAARGIMLLEPLLAAIKTVKTKKNVPINSARYFFMHF
jgi:hypothetical protein